MSTEYKLDIHYYSQYQAAVVIQEDLRAKENNANRITLFNSYALRQMSNLGNIGGTVARILLEVGPLCDSIEYYSGLVQSARTVEELAVYAPQLGALGVDMKELVRYCLVPQIVWARTNSGHELGEIANELQPNVVTIVEKRISNGKHRFLCNLRIAKDKVFLELKPKGFGILGKAVNWYATTSVMVLYRYLIQQHKGDREFTRALAWSANYCGEVFLNGEVNSASLLSLPVKLTGLATKPK